MQQQQQQPLPRARGAPGFGGCNEVAAAPILLLRSPLLYLSFLSALQQPLQQQQQQALEALLRLLQAALRSCW